MLFNSGRINTVSITNMSTRFLDGLVTQMINLNSTLDSKTGILLRFFIEPLVSTFLDKSQGGAYPHVASSTPLFSIGILFGWQSPSDNDIFVNEIKSTYDTILQIALNDGQDVGGSKQIRYPNYAIDDTPLSQMYGNNLDKLKNIRKTWDPNNIMYLTGGFKF